MNGIKFVTAIVFALALCFSNRAEALDCNKVSPAIPGYPGSAGWSCIPPGSLNSLDYMTCGNLKVCDCTAYPPGEDPLSLPWCNSNCSPPAAGTNYPLQGDSARCGNARATPFSTAACPGNSTTNLTVGNFPDKVGFFECVRIDNASNKSYFIPLKTHREWAAFKAAAQSNRNMQLTIRACTCDGAPSCAAANLTWVVDGNTCTGLAPVTATGSETTPAVVADNSLSGGNTGTASFRCNGASFAASPQPGATCSSANTCNFINSITLVSDEYGKIFSRRNLQPGQSVQVNSISGCQWMVTGAEAYCSPNPGHTFHWYCGGVDPNPNCHFSTNSSGGLMLRCGSASGPSGPSGSLLAW